MDAMTTIDPGGISGQPSPSRASVLAVAESTTSWDRLWPVLLAAALAFTAALLVQLWVVPRVEQRKRREDRWERDVRDLGEHVTFAIAETTTAYFSAMHLKWAIEDRAKTAEWLANESVVSRLERLRDDLREHRDAFRNAVQRMRWLDRSCDVSQP